jgi:MFS family permease
MRMSPAIARGLRLSVVEGSLFAVYWNVVAGVIINGLALAAGARPIHLAILNALPLLGQVCGLFAARFLQAHDVRKPLVLLVEGISRAVWLLVPLLVLLPPGNGRVWFVLVVAASSHIIHAAGAVGWISWISDLVPEQIRGVYFGVRAAVAGLVGVAGLLVASTLADSVRTHHGPGREYLNVLLLLVGVSVLFAGLSWIGLLLQPVRRMRRLAVAGWRTIRDSITTGNARNIAVSWGTMAFSLGITTGVYMAFFLDRLHMSLTGMTAYALIALAVSTAMTPVLGRVADRFGHRNMLLIAWGGVFWQPLLSVFTPDDMHHMFGLMPVTILVDAFAGGCFWPAVGVAQNNLVIGEATSENRAGFFAALSALAGLVGFLGAIIGGLVADAVGSATLFFIGDIPIGDLRAPMLLGTLLRAAAGLLILRIREPARSGGDIPGSQAFSVVWRLLIGKPIRAITR